MNVQVIMKDGRPEWAVLPYSEYEALLQKLEALEGKSSQQAAEPAPKPSPTASPTPRRASNASGGLMAQLEQVGDSPEGHFSADKMQQLRQGKGLDQAAVAREVGISPVYLKQIESGEREPGEPVIRNIARALQVEMSQLMDNGD